MKNNVLYRYLHFGHILICIYYFTFFLELIHFLLCSPTTRPETKKLQKWKSVTYHIYQTMGNKEQWGITMPLTEDNIWLWLASSLWTLFHNLSEPQCPEDECVCVAERKEEGWKGEREGGREKERGERGSERKGGG